jgi:hypothetical protein
LKNLQISDIDLKVAVFDRFYKNDFSEEKKKDIIKAMRDYYQ